MKRPFDYNQIFYNEVIYYLEQKWNRPLTEHEQHVLIEGYKYGRLVETENQAQIGFLK
ncbi:hypothetical protein [Mesobacillus maritimus]|uniref:Uncharacterized protein n=1 Tax=Mesobacillus maritimus TaxID=1643336 RepID=A0ABS7K0J9_9BACI|nr:hypothetical protein [Mesobacillus maritimus]MBY0095729.1 hypothetical protein [Mesobacillus maritimus]